MPTTQLSIGTGRRFKRRYAPIVRARGRYLPQIMSLEEARRAREAEMAESKRQHAETTALTWEQMREQKRQQRRANILSGLGLATQAGFGLGKLSGTRDLPEYSTTAVEAPDVGTFGQPTDLVKPTREGGGGLLSSWENLKSKITERLPQMGLGSLTGTVAGGLIRTKHPWKRAVTGAAAGAITSELLGGDIYSNILSGLLGGTGGFLAGGFFD